MSQVSNLLLKVQSETYVTMSIWFWMVYLFLGMTDLPFYMSGLIS